MATNSPRESTPLDRDVRLGGAPEADSSAIAAAAVVTPATSPDPDILRRASSARITLADTVLAARKGQYEELSRTWQTIDTKAQATVAISGILIAGLFGLIRQAAPQSLALSLRVIIAVALFLFLLSLLLATLTLAIRRHKSPHDGAVIERMAMDLWALPDRELQGAIPFFPLDQANLWRAAIHDQRAAFDRKVDYLRVSHVLLATGIFLVGFVVFLMLFPHS